MNEDIEQALKAFYHKHCFVCQGKVSSRLNPLKETEARNWIHKECLESTAWLEPYTEGTLAPKMKRKTRATAKQK